MQLSIDTMYKALVKKDKSFEGIFYAGIKTIGIFCRPTCTARKPNPENVEYFDTPKDALLGGYRPCKLCKPLDKAGETPAYVQSILQKISDEPDKKIKDYDLVEQGIEPNKVRRWFKANHGLTFQAYQRMIRINGAFSSLAQGKKVTEAAFENGYESLSGFGEAFKNVLGNAPSSAKYTNVVNISRFTTPLGPMFACASDEGVCLLEFTDRRMLEFEFREISRLMKAKILYGDNKHLKTVQKQMAEYFHGKRKTFDVPLVFPGTGFQRDVWKMLMDIPYGMTRSYAQQAKILRNPKAVRAVARANGFNRIAVIIPCHRVIGADGHLTGYGGGLWRKKWLLDFEKKNM